MTQETIGKKWGGRRKNAGRKPSPQTLVRKKNAEEKDIAKTVEAYFKTGKTLKCPDDLDDDARIEWNRLMVCYAEQNTNVVSTLDITMLRLFCESYSRYAKAWKAWTKTLKGNIIGEDKIQQKNIERCMKVMQDESKTMKYLAPDLCLTVSGRLKAGLMAVEGAKEKSEDVADQLMSFFGASSGEDEEE